MKLMMLKITAVLIVASTLQASPAPIGSCEALFAPTSISAPVAARAPAPTQRFNLFRYYFDKISELNELDRSAPLAMTLRLLIMNTTLRTEQRLVPLKYLREIHQITRPAATAKLDERKNALLNLPKTPTLTIDILNNYIPSKNPIRVVNFGKDEFVVFDGNGRLVALKQVFDETTLVEVELFYSESKLLQANLRKLLEVRSNLEKAN